MSAGFRERRALNRSLFWLFHAQKESNEMLFAYLRARSFAKGPFCGCHLGSGGDD